jgi:ThiF family
MQQQRNNTLGQRERNHGIVPHGVSNVLRTKTVAIAGVGGVGGLTAEMLVRQCGIRRLQVADIDSFDASNLNRQAGAYHSTLGRPKASVIAAACRDIDPDVEVIEYPAGVDPAALDEFLDGVDLLVNAVDYTAADVYVPLTDRAHALGIPVVVGAEVGYGARAVWFDPDGMSYAEYFKLAASERLPLRRLIMWVPPYSDLGALTAVVRGDLPAPAIATGGLCTASILVPWIEAILSGVDVPRAAPWSFMLDTRAGRARFIRRPTLEFARSLVAAAVRSALGRNAAAV